MLLERAEIQITSGMEKDFEVAMCERGIPLLQALPGAKSVNFGRGVENADKFMLLVEWASMDAHNAFTTAETFSQFRAIVSQFSCGGGIEHFNMQFDFHY